MRVNENALKFAGRTAKGDREGRLQHKSPKEGYRQRWFKLKGNLLFFFRTNDKGQQSEAEPIGVLVLERCEVKLEPISDRPFVFSLIFSGDGGRTHYFSGQTQQQCEDWVTSISKASISYLQAELMLLKSRVQQRIGEDPMEGLYKLLSGRSIHQPMEVPEPRVPTRRAPSPPHSSSTFYSKSAPETFHDSRAIQRGTMQGVRPPPAPVQSYNTDMNPLMESARHTSYGAKPDTKSSGTNSGWELFE